MENQEPIVKNISSQEMAITMGLLAINTLILYHQASSWDSMAQATFDREIMAGGFICFVAMTNSLLKLTGDIVRIAGEDRTKEEKSFGYKTALANAILRITPILPTIAQFVVYTLTQPPVIEPNFPTPPPFLDDGISA